jgi:hypothetical protein
MIEMTNNLPTKVPLSQNENFIFYLHGFMTYFFKLIRVYTRRNVQDKYGLRFVNGFIYVSGGKSVVTEWAITK